MSVIETGGDGRVPIATRTTPAMVRRVDAYAKRLGISRSSAIAILIDHGLQNVGQSAIDFDNQGDIL